MKNFFITALLSIAMFVSAQTTQTINTRLKLTTVPYGVKSDSVLVRGQDGIVKTVSRSGLVFNSLTAYQLVSEKQNSLNSDGTNLKYPTVTAVNNGLAFKENSLGIGNVSQYLRGDKTWQTLNKSVIGLANVDNTSDINKPISTVTQAALDLKFNKSGGDLDGSVGNGYLGLPIQSVVPSTPTSSLVKIFADANGRFSWLTSLGFTRTFRSISLTGNRTYILQDRDGTLADNTDLAIKANIDSPTFTGTVSGVTKSMVGLANADNTSDANKPISTATQTALNLKANDNTAVHLSGVETITNQKIFRGISTGDTTGLSSELSTTASGTNWIGSGFSTGYQHFAGITTALTSSLNAVVGDYYQITWSITGRTAGLATINFGGQSVQTQSTSNLFQATGTFGPRATTTGLLTVVPDINFDGTIVVSVRTITATLTPTLIFQNSAGSITSEIRTPSATNSTFFGLNAGARNLTATPNNSFSNTGFGAGALSNNTTASNNTGVGTNALRDTNIGGSNTAVGVSTLQANTTGSSNTAVGFSALSANTVGISNTATGTSVLQNATSSFNSAFGNNSGNQITTGSQNALFGWNSFPSNITGSNNSVFGAQAGRFITDGVTALANLNNSVFIGQDTRAQADSQTNQIVIGYQAIGNGSNTTTIGNSAITATHLAGQVRVNAQNSSNDYSLPSTRGANGAVLTSNGANAPAWITNFATNSTTAELTAATLNSTYPSVNTGFQVHCLSISAGGGPQIYVKTSTGWASFYARIIN